MANKPTAAAHPAREPVAVVTGATGGIGTAVCQALAREGFSVVVGFRQSQARAIALAAGLPGPGHVALSAPVTDSEALRALSATIRDRYGRCDVLVNCAGTTRFVPHVDLESLDDGLIDDILATNVRGSFAAVRALLPLLKESVFTGGAVVINISSIAARTAMGSNIMYCASKAALDNITRSLARALAPAVRVISVSPGLVDTDFIQSLDPAWRNEQAARTPLGRLADPQDVATAVVVAIRHLKFATGCILAVDGGRPLV